MSENALGKAKDSSTATDKKYRDADWLQEKYHGEGMTSYEMAELASCSSKTVRNWMERHNIERRESGKPAADKRLQDKSWFRQKYIDEGLSTTEIADLCDCARPTVQDWKRKHGVENVTDYKSRGTGSDNPNGKKYTDADCEWCGESLHLPIRRVERADNNFCSHQCNASYRSIHMRGEDHPLYVDGSHENYGENWREIRRQVRKRDSHLCQACGVDESELKRELHVHHIQPRRKFNSLSKANQLENLVSLCGPCHRKWESIGLRPVCMDT